MRLREPRGLGPGLRYGGVLAAGLRGLVLRLLRGLGLAGEAADTGAAGPGAWVPGRANCPVVDGSAGPRSSGRSNCPVADGLRGPRTSGRSNCPVVLLPPSTGGSGAL